MMYSYRQHMAYLAELHCGHHGHLFALVDAGQSAKLADRLLGASAFVEVAQVFEGTFASAAVDYSPLLMQLPDVPSERLTSINLLDELCCALPILGFLEGSLSMERLLFHLRGLLQLHVDETPYLWRFADTQMLQATAAVLSDAQRQRVFGVMRGWYTLDHQQVLRNQAASPVNDAVQAPMGNATAPLILSAAQESALLEQVAGPNLASQLRALEPSFIRALTHAQQTAFAQACLIEARELAVNLDSELLDWTRERWRATCRVNDTTLLDSSS